MKKLYSSSTALASMIVRTSADQDEDTHERFLDSAERSLDGRFAKRPLTAPSFCFLAVRNGYSHNVNDPYSRFVSPVFVLCMFQPAALATPRLRKQKNTAGPKALSLYFALRIVVVTTPRKHWITIIV